MKKPEVWMISMSDCEISQHYKNNCKPTWEDKGFVVNDFEAVTPSKNRDFIDSQFIRFEHKIRNNGEIYEFTDTEKAVWYSHFFLWMKCFDSDTPLIVAEHDAKLLKDITFKKDIGFSFLCHSSQNKQVLACGSYYLTPKVAEYLIERVKDYWPAVYVNVDGFLVYEITTLINHWMDDVISETPAEEVEKVAKEIGGSKTVFLAHSLGKYKYQPLISQAVFDEKVGKTIKHNIKRIGRIGRTR